MAYSAKAVPPGDIDGLTVDALASQEFTNEILCKFGTLLLQDVISVEWQADRAVIGGLLDLRAAHDLSRYQPRCTLGPNAFEYSRIIQILALFKKRRDLGSDTERRETALAAFLAAEERCGMTNRIFRALRQGRCSLRPLVRQVLDQAAWKISNVLGDPPGICDLRPRFGPGATTVVRKVDSCALIKLARPPACSANVDDPSRLLNNFNWLGVDHAEVDIPVMGATLAFVPKNTKTFRAIVTEPPLNGAVQLALGDEIARRLRKRAGIDIQDQTRNQAAARMGSIYGNVATIDLSSASDTVSLGLVEYLLSPDWYDLLCQYRSCEVTYKGRYIPLNKISSMGNGFTFPLETLIFWAISSACADVVKPGWEKTCSPVIAYGDDIIVPTAVAEPLMGVLYDLGFLVNPDKSFWKGEFRESCGQDWFLGVNVRPVFVEDRLSVLDYYRLHNFFHARGEMPLARFWEELVPVSFRQRGPKGFGDGYLHANAWVAARTRKMKSDGHSGFLFRAWVAIPNTLRKELKDRYQSRREAGTFKSQFYDLVARLACYISYRRETRSDMHWLDPEPPVNIWGTPGVLGYQLKRLHVFEPPYLVA